MLFHSQEHQETVNFKKLMLLFFDKKENSPFSNALGSKFKEESGKYFRSFEIRHMPSYNRELQNFKVLDKIRPYLQNDGGNVEFLK